MTKSRVLSVEAEAKEVCIDILETRGWLTRVQQLEKNRTLDKIRRDWEDLPDVIDFFGLEQWRLRPLRDFKTFLRRCPNPEHAQIKINRVVLYRQSRAANNDISTRASIVKPGEKKTLLVNHDLQLLKKWEYKRELVQVDESGNLITIPYRKVDERELSHLHLAFSKGGWLLHEHDEGAVRKARDMGHVGLDGASAPLFQQPQLSLIMADGAANSRIQGVEANVKRD